MSAPVRSVVELSIAVEEPRQRWLLEDQDVPETPLHDAIIELLMLILKRWVEATGRSALVCSNLGCRWDPADARVGTDPDVVLVEPCPPEGELTKTLRVWEPGHAPPRVAVEVVSDQNPDKDYVDAPVRCARLGAEELWVFDPTLAGPTYTGGPFLLQVFRREATAARARMVRTYAGPGPGFSDALGAWLVATDGGTRLRLATDPAGLEPWPTAHEHERAEKERERAEKDRALAWAARLEDALRGAGLDPDDL